MNRALWRKAIFESRWLLLATTLALLAFMWLRVWLVSQLPLGQFKLILNLLPSQWEKLSAVPFNQIATPVGRIAVAFDEPIVLLLFSIWAIARGSDAVSGEIGRGTMEMLLAQPVTRRALLVTQALATIAGAAVLSAAAWLGTWVGLATITLEEPVAAGQFFPAVVNEFAMCVFLAGLTTLVSSCDRYRWRTIGLVGGFFAVEMVVKLVGRMAPGYGWLAYGSFITPLEPQLMVGNHQWAWSWIHKNPAGELVWGGLSYNGLLLGLAFCCYALALETFARRDLPAPL